MKNILIAILCCGALNTARASAKPWNDLTAPEQQVLAPIQPQWRQLSDKQHHHFRHLAHQYSALSTNEKMRFSIRLSSWAKLTPRQRQAARDKYRAFSRIPKEKREQVKKMIR
ncbi:MAG: DUF3106 domain-containing protein [Gallionella sp.]